MSMTTDKNKILEKLRKLMNLKESATAIGNQGEAAAAAAGISRLLLMYNLSESDIPAQERIDNPIVAEEIPFKPEVIGGQWYEYLVNCICKFNLCEALVVSSCKKKRYYKNKFQIIGRQRNVEVVLYLISFLANNFYLMGKRDYPQYKHDCLFIKNKLPETEHLYLRSYLYGCVCGLHYKLESEKKELQKNSNITSLEISLRSEIEDFLKGQNIGKCRLKKQNYENECARKGFITGKNVEINKGIYSETISKERRLES